MEHLADSLMPLYQPIHLVDMCLGGYIGDPAIDPPLPGCILKPDRQCVTPRRLLSPGLGPLGLNRPGLHGVRNRLLQGGLDGRRHHTGPTAVQERLRRSAGRSRSFNGCRNAAIPSYTIS